MPAKCLVSILNEIENIQYIIMKSQNPTDKKRESENFQRLKKIIS